MRRLLTGLVLRTVTIGVPFLALPGSRVVAADADTGWSYWESKMAKGGLSIDVATVSPTRRPRTVLRFNFRTDAKCEPTVGMAIFHIGDAYGEFQSSGTAPEEWAVQVDEGPPEQRATLSVLYMNALEMVLPVSHTFVGEAKSGRQMRMWQTKTGIAPPPHLAHVEVSLRGAAKPLERAEARCAEAIKR